MSEDGRPDTKAAVRDAWTAALETDRIGDDDSFFDLGGHSLLGAKAMASLSRTYGQRLTLRLLFSNPTVRLLAAAIDERLSSGVAAP
jgi:phthiocerol/phenolphthiocerol synthesis type-I polyketide synthase E